MLSKVLAIKTWTKKNYDILGRRGKTISEYLGGKTRGRKEKGNFWMPSFARIFRKYFILLRIS